MLTSSGWREAPDSGIFRVTAVSSVVVKGTIDQTILYSSAGYIVHQDGTTTLAIEGIGVSYCSCSIKQQVWNIPQDQTDSVSIIESQGTSAEDLIARYSQERAFDRYMHIYTFRLNSLTLELQMMYISLYGFTRSTNADTDWHWVWYPLTQKPWSKAVQVSGQAVV